MLEEVIESEDMLHTATSLSKLHYEVVFGTRHARLQDKGIHYTIESSDEDERDLIFEGYESSIADLSSLAGQNLEKKRSMRTIR